MKTEYQQSETDCGPAAVATLCGVSVQDASQYIYGKLGRKGVTSSGYLVGAIEHFGRRPLADRCSSFKEDHELPNFEFDALLGCDCLVLDDSGRYKRSSHWAVWDMSDQCIRDPYGYYYPLLIRKFLLVR